ncbi:MAG: hypothetical protein DRJ02_00305 [Bacteroidetes bacterium]|nr:MAG: hypothetical protein DRJ02_00305 [Bacteroidota bacterium]
MITKKIRFYKLTGLLMALLYVTGCAKNPFDHRTKYIGDYDFRIDFSCTPSLGNCDTTYHYQGNIDYSDDKDKVIIHYDKNRMIEPLIDENENLIQHIDHYQDDSLGRFINKNEVEFVVRDGGLGGGFFWHAYGKKK